MLNLCWIILRRLDFILSYEQSGKDNNKVVQMSVSQIISEFLQVILKRQSAHIRNADIFYLSDV